MRDIDASSIVYGWDNYPIRQFPSVWDWINSEITDGELMMSRIAFEEVKTVSPDCAVWLKDKGISLKDVTNDIANIALDIKNALGITNDNYHPDGVGENDIFIIATSQVTSADIISDENRQSTLPANMRKYKIPAVCNLSSVDVQCINFVEHIKQANRIFG
ncbi:MAG: hypothetical protein DHS20C01_35960 [marine bacterium B5-7]|nr:MAG: hypothetical protein DHS20C01_35960 [marine bacterium B5-7]